MSESIDKRSYEELSSAIALAQHTVYKDYLTELSAYSVVQPPQILLDQSAKEFIRLFRLDELSCKKGEDMFQKLSTVYHASMSLGCNLIVMIDAKSTTDPVDVYLGVRRTDADDKNQLNVSFRALQDGLASNFPGTRRHPIESQADAPELIEEIFGKNAKHIASVSCVAALRDKSKTENKSFIQGMERFIDAMRGNAYTALFIAEPVLPGEQAIIRSGYEELYSSLSPFRKSTWSYNENESTAVMESLTKGTSHAVTNGTTHTQGHTINVGMNIGMNGSKNESESHGHTEPSKLLKTARLVSKAGDIAGVLGVLAPVAAVAFPPAGAALGVAAGALKATDKILGGAGRIVENVMNGSSDSVNKTVGRAVGISGGLNAGYARSVSDSISESITDTISENVTNGKTKAEGTGRTLQIEKVHKSIEELLKRIEEQLKRTQEGEDYGSYSCGAYFLSGKPESSILAANTYRALMLGEGSSVESGAINAWNGVNEPERVAAIKEYLRRFVHPIFAMPVAETAENTYQVMTYTPGTTVSGLELPLHLGLPTRSVYGLPVLEYAEFGRNVKSRNHREDRREAVLGRIYHMGQTEAAPVPLDTSELTAHTFITGSTGAGKSNTIYKMLDELCFKAEKPAHFLVIEPAKGEYKDVFGGRGGVTVYGTNPKKTALLRLNPFSFPDDIHVLEHIDRLVEVFNACWPMYAAMPAVLKDAMEAAYIGCGWSLTRSDCMPRRFPTFADVLKKLPEIMEVSAYSKDTKGDYTGALVTRVKSLTNGINGQIFCPDNEILDRDLFDQNVIVDLSRVGSMETKALLMGILMIKLQEYRMAEASGSNAELRHVTVLEEAHNLLRRTAAEQSQESSNLQGKSVEMLANAIAEMRTYGEGFIIADQAPGLLDLSVIRNTNTKIIMRLPDESDRKLAGRAAGLNDDQIVELARLDPGVAAVFQNHWLEPVLCRVDLFRDGVAYEKPESCPPQEKTRTMDALFRLVLHGTADAEELTKEEADRIRSWVDRLDAGSGAKRLLLRTLDRREAPPEEVRGELLYCLVRGKSIVERAERLATPSAAQADADQRIMEILQVSAFLAEEIRLLIFRYASEQVRKNEARFLEIRYCGGVK